MPRRFENKEEVAAAASCDTPYSAFRGTKFFGSLDGLRAISIMGVVWVHATLASPYYLRFSVLPIIGNGAFGVDIFFAISGFLISTLLLRERDKLGKISLREFYLRRTLRIWPLYYATLAFYAAMALIFYRHSPRGPEFFHYFPGYLTFTYTWFAFRSASKPIFNFAWSLSVEEQFYTLWAPVLRFLDRLSPLLIMVGLIALRISASYGLLGKVLPPDSLFFRIATNISVSICLGVLLAHTLNSRKGFEKLYPFLGRKWSAPVALALMFGCLALGSSFWLAQSATLFALIGACVIRETNGLAIALTFRPLAYIGRVSYGVYMLNTLVVDALHSALSQIGIEHPAVTFPLFLGISVIVASVSYRYFESPFLTLKTRFSRQVSTKHKILPNLPPKAALSLSR